MSYSENYSHKLSGFDATILKRFHVRIIAELNVRPSFDAMEYIPYTLPEDDYPFVYADRRIANLRVLIDTPYSELSQTQARGFYEPCVAFPKFNGGRSPNNRVMIFCKSLGRIESIINTIDRLR